MMWSAPLDDLVERDLDLEKLEFLTYAARGVVDGGKNADLFTDVCRCLEDVTLIVQHDVFVRNPKSAAGIRR